MHHHLELDNVSFGYDPDRPVIKGLSEKFEPGGFTLVRGRSGMGKSTLLRLLNRLEEPTRGEIRYQGKPLAELSPSLLRREISYIQQTPVVVEGSVRENLLLPFSFQANTDLERPDDDRLGQLLKDFMLEGVSLDDKALNCSVGQRQRLCLIRAILLKPLVMLLDEPTSALDPESREMVESLTEHLNQDKGLTLIMVSHHDFTPGVPHRVLTLNGEDRDQSHGAGQ